MNIKPLSDRVVVKSSEPEEKKQGGPLDILENLVRAKARHDHKQGAGEEGDCP